MNLQRNILTVADILVPPVVKEKTPTPPKPAPGEYHPPRRAVKSHATTGLRPFDTRDPYRECAFTNTDMTTAADAKTITCCAPVSPGYSWCDAHRLVVFDRRTVQPQHSVPA